MFDYSKLGWSDIDILILTKQQISERQANQLLCLRQILLCEEPSNPYYCSFECGMLTLDALVNHSSNRVVYWGTNGECITNKDVLTTFYMSELPDNDILVYGNDIRDKLSCPTFKDLKANV